MKKKMILLSHDAMFYDDLDYLSSKPAFSYLLENGSRIDTLRTVYPSITYPAHVSMISGVYPDRHGITNNELDNIGELSSPWHWFAEDHSAYTLFEAAKKAGMSTAAVFWPVTGNDKNIDYLIDEYWSQSHDDDIIDVFRRSGTSDEVIEKVVKKNLPLLKGHERCHPEADSFIIACACDIIEQFNPDFLAIHPAEIDGARHKYGLFGKESDLSLEYTERWTSMIMESVMKTGNFENTDFIVMSDHGQLEIKRTINLNVILRENGFISVDDNECITDWSAFIKSTALSAQVFLKDPSDKIIYDKVYSLLLSLCDEGIYGISRVYTAEEALNEEHLSGAFSFVLESDGFTSYSNKWSRPLITNIDISDYRFGKATHGHNPDKGPQPTFIGCGPSFKKGMRIERRNIVDIAPTLAKALEINLPSPDGISIDEILY